MIFIERSFIINGVSGYKVDTTTLFNNIHRQDYFIDVPIHTNKYANKAIVQLLYDDYLSDEMRRKKDLLESNHYLQAGEVLGHAYKKEVMDYIERVPIKQSGDKKNGGIVMNCNPFTLGHQFLIEYAAKRVDLLYVFVVEEDKSDFSFKDRMEMVREGTKHLKNVAVVPSGKWILSYDTMPIYFEKSIRKEEKINAELDLQIFARYIAQQLGISVRFVGEEPMDKITGQYNEQMRAILHEFGIAVEEVPRKKADNQVISASLVRKYVQEEKWSLVKKYIPETTYKKIRGQIKC